MSDVTQLCTFVVGDLYLGIDVQRVQEVLRQQVVTAVPLAPREIRGLINLRGQIVTAIDLRSRLGLPAQDGAAPMNVILRSDDAPVSLLVDEIHDVVDVQDKAIEQPPSTLDAEKRKLVSGVIQLKERLLMVLRPEVACVPKAA